MGIVLVDRHHAIVLRLLNVHQLGRSNDTALAGYQVVNPVIALAELCTDSETVVIRLAFTIEITAVDLVAQFIEFGLLEQIPRASANLDLLRMQKLHEYELRQRATRNLHVDASHASSQHVWKRLLLYQAATLLYGLVDRVVDILDDVLTSHPLVSLAASRTVNPESNVRLTSSASCSELSRCRTDERSAVLDI